MQQPPIFASLLFLLCFIFSDSARTLDQFRASCFSGCRCNSTVVECKGLRETKTELFQHVLPKIYPSLDTLVVTGNQFGVIPDENIFGAGTSGGDNLRHKHLTLVNLSSNGISSFGAQTFIGMPRVEYFYLSNNRLDSLDDDQPFNFFTSLKLIDLDNVFGEHISAKAKADLIRRIFHNNHSFIDLQEVILTNNRLEYLHPDTFCNVKGLMRLNLGGNHLTAFDFKPRCLNSLHVLDLSANHIQSVPKSLWKGLPSLDTADFSHNPLKCDCELEAFHEFARSEVNSFLNQEVTTCASPASMSGKRIFSTDINMCRFEGGLWRWLLLLCIAIAFLFAYRFYCRGRELFMSRSLSQLRVPLVDGYSKLRSAEEVQPAFV